MDIVLRSALAFLFLLVLTRLIGRRELGAMQPFDLLLLVVIGDLIQQGVTQQDLSLLGGVLAVGTFALMIVGVSMLGYRFPLVRPFLEGRPLIVVQDGKPIERNLRRERITVEEVAAEARLQQIASLDDVRWAVLESGGRFSFIQK